jgi:predicted MFS family arabinose efflux permease
METEVLGLIMSGAGAGMLVGSTILSKLEIKNMVNSLGLGAAVLGLAFVGEAVAVICLEIRIILAVAPTLAFAAGCTFAFVLIPFQTAAQKETPVEYSGRVFGTINSVFTLATIGGTLSGGILVSLIEINKVFIISGVSLSFVGLLIVMYGMVKRGVFQRWHQKLQKHTESVKG